jgi:hypothetical protein
MHIFDHDLPEKSVFNFVLGAVVVVVVFYAGYLNYLQYKLVAELRAGQCDEKCVRQIVESRAGQSPFKLDQFERPIAAVDTSDLQIVSTKPTPKSLSKTKVIAEQPYESFRSVTGGTASSTDWKAVNSEVFGFDLGLYPEGSVVTFEGWMTLADGASRGYVRMYDLTNNRMVDGSEVEVSATGRSSFYSPAVSIWRGTNQYRLEVRSDTGYEVRVDSVRLVIKKM